MATSKKGGDDLAREARELLEEDHQADKSNRDEAVIDLKFVAGDQWPENVKAQRRNRPSLTINRLPQFINQVVNDFRINSPGLSVIPVDSNTDPELADIYNGMLRAIQYCSNANSVWASAFSHSVQCGIGWFRIVTDYADSDSFDQEIQIKRIANPLSVYHGPSIEPDRSDAPRIFVTEMVRKSVFETRFKGAAKTSFEVPDASNLTNLSGFFWTTSDDIRIAEYWRKVPYKRKIVRLQDGKVVDLNEYAKFMGIASDEVRAYLPPVNAEREVEDHRVEHALVSGSEVLEKTTVWPGKYIPIIPIIGQEIPLGDKTFRHGLIRFARDPQQMYNFWSSVAAETIGLAPKAPYLVTPTMIAEFKDQWDSHNTTNRPYLLYNPDDAAPGGRPSREPPPDVPVALFQQSAIASDDMKATMGMYDASVGQRSNETSGKAINARQREGDVATYHFRDNFNVSLVHCGRVIIDLIPKVYDTERVVRLMAEEAEDRPKFATVNQQVMSDNGEPVLRNDLKAGKFDIRVKIGPSYTTRRQEAADSMVQFATAYPPTMQYAGDLIAKAMDWPDADKIAERLKKTIPPNVLGDDQDEPNPQQQAAMQQQQQLEEVLRNIQLERAQLENDELRTKNEKTVAETQKTEVDAVDAAIEALIKSMQAGIPLPSLPPQHPNGAVPGAIGGSAAPPFPSPGMAPAAAGPSPNPQALQGLMSQAPAGEDAFVM